MEYNTQREKLEFIDYGRNVRKLVEYAKSIEDRDKRNKVVESIIGVMSQVNTHVRDSSDYKHKLWDHLMIMSKGELDVDYPYEEVNSKTLHFSPERIEVSKERAKYGHYGKLLESMVRSVSTYEEGEEREELIKLLAQNMKRLYKLYNNEQVGDDVIRKQLMELSEGGISDMGEQEIVLYEDEVHAEESQEKKQKHKRKKK